MTELDVVETLEELVKAGVVVGVRLPNGNVGWTSRMNRTQDELPQVEALDFLQRERERAAAASN